MLGIYRVVKNRKFLWYNSVGVFTLRALLKDPEVLILDEPTSALDTYSVDKLIEEINEQKMNRITIVISHDERFINIADVNVNL